MKGDFVLKVAINYADQKYRVSQKYNTMCAYRYGKLDKVIEFGPRDIDQEFKKNNSQWFVEGQAQIGRYGLWRPHIVKKTFDALQEGDYLFYSDSGCYLTKSIELLINVLNKSKQEVMVFDLPYIEKEWTKRDVFLYFACDTSAIADGNQRLSTFFLLKKGDQSAEFVERYYQATLDMPALFTDEPNQLGKENYEEFIQNRHNQSVLSVLTKAMGIRSYRDPSQFGLNPYLYRGLIPGATWKITEHVESTYPSLIIHHRSNAINWKHKLYYATLSRIPADIYRKWQELIHG